MPRVIIWSECQYTILALEAIISRLPFHVDIISFPSANKNTALSSSDYFILDPSHKSFARCYEFLVNKQGVFDESRTLLYSEPIDSTIMATLLKRKIPCFSKTNSLQNTQILITKFILLKDIVSLCEQHSFAITKMEIKILSMLVSGISVRDISMILKRSIKTVSAHKCNLFKKIGVNNNQELFFLFNHSISDMSVM